DSSKINYRLLQHSSPVFTVEEAAAQRGVSKDEMVKSILLRDKDEHYVMACVLGYSRVNPKAVRTYVPTEWRRLSFATSEEILSVTGCVQGAVAPLGLPDNVPVIFDEAITQCRKVNISSGDPAAGLELKIQDLISAAAPQIAAIADSE
ncbi:YbaK/EbsC family protein, partial [Candidatus Poribacteria bacterium]|nr:YbaK/EbsC family protein [Candidatus Poribacteria bacterium]